MKWEVQVLKGTLHTMYGPSLRFTHEFKKKYGVCFSKNLVVFKKGVAHYTSLYQELLDMGNFIINRFKKEPEFLNKVIKSYLNWWDKLHNVFAEINLVDVKKIPDKELFEFYDKVETGYSEQYGWSYCVEPIDIAIDYYLKNKLKMDKEKFKKYFSILTTPPEESFVSREKIGLLKIALVIREHKDLNGLFKKSKEKIEEELRKNHPDIHDLIKKHTKEFFWIRANYFEAPFLKETDFIEILKELVNSKDDLVKELNKVQNHIPKIIKEKNEIIKKEKFDKDFMFLIYLIDKWGFIHDSRKELMMKCFCYLDLLMGEIGKRCGYTIEETRWCSPREVRDICEGKKVNKELLHKRMDYCIVYIGLDGEKIMIGDEAKNYEEKELKEEQEEAIDSIKGIAASMGRITARANIVLDAKNITKMKKGDVLVTTMTRPDFVPVMKKAAAVVTDQGGITSHAAIVSRELGIPCIVGTKVATKVIKDGDLIEVNANHGVVKVVEKNG